MNNLLKIVLLIGYLMFWGSSVSFAQKNDRNLSAFTENLNIAQLLTDTENYTAAMIKLRELEKWDEVQQSTDNLVKVKLLIVRVLRLSGDFDDAMDEINLIPSLKNNPKLKLKVDFSKAALFTENPKYSVAERNVLANTIIEESILLATSMKDTDMLASFLNLKASMLKDECIYENINCEKNYAIASELYKESLKYFLTLKDTNNYHNTLNNLFQLEMDNETIKIDSVKTLIENLLIYSTYGPNVINSHNQLYSYYKVFRNDSIKSLLELILARDAMMELMQKNADNSIEKMKLLCEFDTLKSSVAYNEQLVLKQDVEQKEKSQRVYQALIFGIILVVLALILVFLLLKQRLMTKKLDISNAELNKSNNDYQLLIRESNHRIKNNLQMILSMLELDKTSAKEEDKKLFSSISAKISTITSLHRILNFKEHNQKIDIPIYFEEIIAFYKDLYPNRLIFKEELAAVAINSERIIYFGLILNEMISNTVKHRKNNGDVTISVLREQDRYVFIYKDNSGFGDYTKNNGLTLIEGLVERFGGTDFEIASTIGLFKFYFNE